MYLWTSAKKLDFMWKMLRHERDGLQAYLREAQKTKEVLVNTTPILSVTPESQGLSSEEIINFYTELSNSKKFKPHSIVILKNGKAVSKAAWKPYLTSIRHVMHSMSKSLVSLAIGIAEGEGLLKLDERVCDIFPQYFSLISSKRIREVRIFHLLTMSTGARFCDADTVFENDWVKGFIEGELKWNPGEKFEYNSINTYILSAVLSKKTGMSLIEYLTPRLFDVLGIKDVLWEKSPKGIEKGGWGCYLGVEEMAKIGQLCLNKGAWTVNGEIVQVVPKSYIEKAVSPNGLATGDSFGYGYQFWTMGSGFMLNGMFGQYVLCFPQQDIVIALNSGADNMFADPDLVALAEKYFVKGRAKKLLPLNRAALARLRKLETSLEYGEKIVDGNAEKSPSVSVKDSAQKLAELNGTVYEIDAPPVSVLPLVVQCMQSNFAEGVKKLAFHIENGQFYAVFICNDEALRLNIGMSEPAVSTISVNGEKFKIAVKGEFKRDEDDRDVLKIKIFFLELTSIRIIKVVFCEDGEIIVRMTETPVIEEIINEFVMRNDESLPKNIVDTMENKTEIVDMILMRLSHSTRKGRLIEGGKETKNNR